MCPYSLRFRSPHVSPLCCVAMLVLSQGCVIPIPLAVFPVTSEYSGMTIAFHDEDGEPIRKDGLLILHRTTWVIGTARALSQLLEIRDGTVTLPEQSRLAVVGLAWYKGIPWAPLFGDLVSSTPNVYPFIPGYSYEYDFLMHCANIKRDGGRVILRESDEEDAQAFIHWCRPFYNLQTDKGTPTPTHDTRSGMLSSIVLNEQDRLRLDLELERLRSQPPAMPPPYGVTSQSIFASSPTSHPPP